MWFSNMIGRMTFAPILPIIEDEFQVNHAGASSIFIFQSIGYALAMVVSGLYAGRFGYKKSIVVSLAATSLSFFLIPFVKVFSLLYVFVFITGVSIGVYLPAALPLITEYFTERNWARAISIHALRRLVAIFLCPLIAVFLLQFFAWRGIFQILGVVFLVDAVVFWLMGHEVKVIRPEKNAFGELFGMRSLWTMLILFIIATGANVGLYNVTPLYLTKELSFGIGYANRVLAVSRLGAIGVALAMPLFVGRIDQVKTLFILLLVAGATTVLVGAAPAAYTGVLYCIQAIAVTGFFPLALILAAKIFSREMRSLSLGSFSPSRRSSEAARSPTSSVFRGTS